VPPFKVMRPRCESAAIWRRVPPLIVMIVATSV
jgi:hypothetical protein